MGVPQDDLFELNLPKSFKVFYFLQTLSLLSYSVLFSFLERGQVWDGINFNWRSYFFFLSVTSLLALNWIWHLLLKPLLQNKRLKRLIPQLNIPLILVPPLLLQLHHTLYFKSVFFVTALLGHGVLFQTLKEEENDFWIKSAFGFNFVLAVMAAFVGSESLIFSLIVGILNMGLFLFRNKISRNLVFIPTLVLGWGVLFFQIY